MLESIDNYTLPPNKSLGLKVVYSNGQSASLKTLSFRWNLELGGETDVPAPSLDWELLVWAWAQGTLIDPSTWDQSDVIWLALEFDSSEAVDLICHDEVYGVKIHKTKTIALSPDKKDIISFIKLHTPPENRGLFFFDEKTVLEGDVEVGDGGIAITRSGSAWAGKWGTAIAGGGGTAIAGAYGTAVAGRGGTAKAGLFGTAEAGDDGVAEVGDYGCAKAGSGGRLVFNITQHGRFVGRDFVYTKPHNVHLVGVDGIKPDTFYYRMESGRLIEASK